ncbi:MAG: peptidoglycan editing factor PgeF [Burkholderiaceae bacterium]
MKSVFTTRAGGVSRPPFDTFNLGRPSGDDPAAVDSNRAHLQETLGLAPTYMSQVHGTATVTVTHAPRAGDKTIEADGCVSATPGVVCLMRVADCLPVLLSDLDGLVVAAAHAGWRGLAGGVLERNFDAFEKLLVDAAQGAQGPAADRTLAWLGPCIGPEAFEVGAEVRAAFIAHDPAAEECFVPRNSGHKWLADLPGLARQRLRARGITRIYGNDGSAPWCTVGNPSRFFSHRRDSVALGGSGRMAACIWID